MTDCNVSVPTAVEDNGSLEVSEKYIQLMQDTMSDDSLYIRTKDTLFAQFNQLQITEQEKAELIANFMTKFAIQMSSTALQSAVLWAKEERDGGWELATAQANANLVEANIVKTKEEICATRAKIDLTCAQTETAIAGSIRENGAVKLRDPNNACRPIALNNNGLKYYQTKQVQADAYRLAADTYRKSGVVDIGGKQVLNTAWVDDGNGTTPDANGQEKYLDEVIMIGISGTTHSEDNNGIAGYTAQQTANAERQRIAYEDAKVNHAANSSASMIGQMLSGEVAPVASDVDLWRDSVKALLKKHSSTDSL